MDNSMNTFFEILMKASELGFSPLNLVLIGMIYFIGAQHGMFPKFWNTNDQSKGVNLKDLHTEFTSLKEYVNHDTSERLESIQADTAEINEGVKQINRKHDEYDRFGIKTRPVNG